MCGLALALQLGCASRPAGRLVVDSVELKGAREVEADDVLDKLATRPSSTLLGVPHGAGLLSVPLDYEVYDPFVVERDVQRVERYYRARGYYGSRVWAARVVRLPGDRVRVELHVDEGQASTVGKLKVSVRGPISSEAATELNVALRKLKDGDRFDEEAYGALKQSIARALTDKGYAHAALQGGFATSDLVPDGGNPRPLPAGSMPPHVEGDDEGDERGEAGGPGPTKTTGTAGTPGTAGTTAAGTAGTAGTAAGTAGTAGTTGAGTAGGTAGTGGVVEEAEKGRRYGVRVDPTARRVDVLLRVDPGPPCVYGAVQIQGLQGLPEDRIRDTINLRPGARYSTADLEEARHALLALNVFSSVEYEADLGRGSERPRVIPVTFRLAPAPLHTTSLGGGVRADTVQSDVHAVMGYEHGNFLGGLRRLTLQARPGVVLYPITTSNLQPLPTKLLFQMQAKAELRQPSFLEARTNGTLRLEGVLRPFILPSAADKELEQVLGFYEFRGTLGLDRAFFDNRLVLGVSSNAQISVPFAYCKFVNIFCRREAVDELSPLVVTYVAATQAIDLRDDAIRPRRGVYLLNEVQVALGKVNDVRVQPDLRTYLPLGRRATLATRASVGFLLPSFGSYGGTYDGGEVSVRDLQLLFLRGFFSGGPNSNRGYPTAGVGQLDVPTKTLGQFLVGEDCYDPDAGGTADQPRPAPFVPSQRCYLPLGGLSTWEASIELRVQLSDTVSLVPFADASDVTRKRGRLRLTQPHPSTGLGLRYDTPIGPLRLDVGYAVPRTAFGVSTANEWGVEPNFLGLGLPVAFNIAFGEAF